MPTNNIDDLLPKQQMAGSRRPDRPPMVANSSYKVDKSANSVESERSYGQPSSSESSANISQNLLLTDFDSYATSNSVSSYPSSVLQNDSLDCNSNTLQTPMPRCSICKAESTGIHFGVSSL